MNENYILTHPEVCGGKKVVTREQTHVEVDHQTGEIVREVVFAAGAAGREPDYIKIYTDCMLVVNNISPGLAPYVIAFSRWMTYANFDVEAYRCTVQTNEIVRKDVAAYVGVSDARVKQAIKELIAAEIFIPISIDGKQKRGIYFVNPWVVGKGEWKDIKELRASFEFVSGAKSVLSIESNGERRVLMPLTEERDGQLAFNVEAITNREDKV